MDLLLLMDGRAISVGGLCRARVAWRGAIVVVAVGNTLLPHLALRWEGRKGSDAVRERIRRCLRAQVIEACFQAAVPRMELEAELSHVCQRSVLRSDDCLHTKRSADGLAMLSDIDCV